MKKTLSLALALIMCLSMLPMAASAEDDFSIHGGLLTSYLGPGGDITIPSSVTEIGDAVFGECDALTSVVIPDSVTKIGDSAFDSCTGLTSINIPASVTEIGRGAFSGCSALTSIAIPDGVEIINSWTFSFCPALTSVTIPNSVTRINWCAFNGCTGLTSVTIPDGVADIDDRAFDGCTGLTSVTVPDSVTRIGWLAFNGCTGLTSVTIPASVTFLSMAAFEGCTSLADVYFGGSKEQWDAAREASEDYVFSECGDTDYVDEFADGKTTIHYNSAAPSEKPADPEPEKPALLDVPDTGTVTFTTQKVNIDGKAVDLLTATVKISSGSVNYVYIRDLAVVLAGTDAKFNVGWDGVVNLIKGTSYKAEGVEFVEHFTEETPYTKPDKPTKLDGAETDFKAIQLKNSAGAYTYYQLRDLGYNIGFNVGWTAEKGMFIETDKPYDPNN